jgi:uncharacterized membrane protein YfcA
MNILFATTAFALLCGLLTFALLRWVLWDIDITALGSIVGLGAVIGGWLGGWIARRRAARAAPGADRDKG